MLKFSPQNAKTRHLTQIAELSKYLQNKRRIYSLDLPSGLTCPGARDCKSKAVKVGDKWKIKDGPHCRFRCFSASQEIVFPATRRARQHNYAILKGMRSRQIVNEFERSMPNNLGILRWHVGGDFFSLSYLQAAVMLAERHPSRLFYAYTKSLHHLAKIDKPSPNTLCIGMLRVNFMITASKGGQYDDMIGPLKIRTAKVIFSESEANGLPIDHDDSHAATPGSVFCLLLHGIQPAKTDASKALLALRKKGVGSYGR